MKEKYYNKLVDNVPIVTLTVVLWQIKIKQLININFFFILYII